MSNQCFQTLMLRNAMVHNGEKCRLEEYNYYYYYYLFIIIIIYLLIISGALNERQIERSLLQVNISDSIIILNRMRNVDIHLQLRQ